MEFKAICQYRRSLRLSSLVLGVSPSILIFRFGEIHYNLCGIPTGRYLVKIREGWNVLAGTGVL